MEKKVTRREVLEAGAAGLLLMSGLAALKPEEAVAETATGKRKVTLKVKLPRNVDFKTEIQKTDISLPAESVGVKSGKVTPATLEMDLTTEKTAEWLKSLQSKATRDSDDADGRFTVHCKCTACCVRG